MREYDLADGAWRDMLREPFAEKIRETSRNPIIMKAFNEHIDDFHAFVKACNAIGINDDALLSCLYVYMTT